MKVKLLQDHFFHGDLYMLEGTILGEGGVPLPARFMVTPQMEPLDTEAEKAIAKVKGEFIDPIRGVKVPSTEPPIAHPLSEKK